MNENMRQLTTVMIKNSIKRIIPLMVVISIVQLCFRFLVLQVISKNTIAQLESVNLIQSELTGEIPPQFELPIAPYTVSDLKYLLSASNDATYTLLKFNETGESTEQLADLLTVMTNESENLISQVSIFNNLVYPCFVWLVLVGAVIGGLNLLSKFVENHQFHNITVVVTQSPVLVFVAMFTIYTHFIF